jgi:hypothetical protein
LLVQLLVKLPLKKMLARSLARLPPQFAIEEAERSHGLAGPGGAGLGAQGRRLARLTDSDVRHIAGSPSVGLAFDPGFDRIFGARNPSVQGENRAIRVAIRTLRAGDARERFAVVPVHADHGGTHSHAGGLGRRFGGNLLRRLPLRPLGRRGAGAAIRDSTPESVGSLRSVRSVRSVCGGRACGAENCHPIPFPGFMLPGCRFGRWGIF